jgi:hypothetical protein
MFDPSAPHRTAMSPKRSRPWATIRLHQSDPFGFAFSARMLLLRPATACSCCTGGPSLADSREAALATRRASGLRP